MVDFSNATENRRKAADILAMIDDDLLEVAKQAEEFKKKKAEWEASKGLPRLLWIKPGTILLRPLYNLGDCLPLLKHNLYNNSDPKSSINAICGVEEEGDCAYCEDAEQNSKLIAQQYYYLPVYVYEQRDEHGDIVMFQIKQDDGSKVNKPVQGVKILELSRSGRIGDILSALRKITKNPKYRHTITGCDFTLSQDGSGQSKKLSLVPDPAEPMQEEIKKLIPDEDTVRKAVLAALPCVFSDDAPKRDLKNSVRPLDEDEEHPF